MNVYTALGRLRWLGLLEGTSFILLLGIAMPLKYLAGRPEFVRVVGMAHGILFLVYMLCLLQAALEYRWSVKKVALLFLSTLVPFGTFVADYQILRNESEPA